MRTKHKTRPAITSFAFVALASSIYLCAPARATVDAFSTSAPNWLGEIVFAQNIWTCNATAGALSKTSFDTEKWSNKVDLRFRYKANKSYAGGNFMADFKFFVGGVRKVTNSCNGGCTGYYTYPFTCQNGSKTYTVKLTTDVSGSWTIEGQGISRNCSASSGDLTLTINRLPCPSTVAVDSIPSQTRNTQSINITGTVTDNGCGNTVTSSTGCVKITVTAPDNTTTTSGWRTVSAGTYSWTYNFPTPKLPKHFGAYSVTASYDGSNDNHDLKSDDSNAETFTLLNTLTVPTPPICASASVCRDASRVYIVDDADSDIYIYDNVDLQPSATVNLDLDSFTLQGVTVIQDPATCEPTFYLTQHANSSILVYDLTGVQQEIIASPLPNPSGLASDCQGSLWVAGHDVGGELVLMDLNTHDTVHSINPPLDMITDIAWDDTTGTLLVLADGLTDIYRLSPADGQIMEELPLDSPDCKAIAALDGGIYIGDYNTREFYLWGRKTTTVGSISDFELHTDSEPNAINLSWTWPDLDPDNWNRIRIYHNGRLLDTVPSSVKFYSHKGLVPYSYHRYCLAAYNETEDLEGSASKVLGAYASLPRQPLDRTCRELKAAGLPMDSDLNGDCIANSTDLALFASKWLLDLVAPPAPTNLTATTAPGHVRLQWDENTETDVDGYNLYRAQNNRPYLLTAQNLTSNSYNDHTVIEGQTYHYVVTAADASNNESGYSNKASASP